MRPIDYNVRGFLVRWPLGQKYVVYDMPGSQAIKIVVYPHGVSVCHPRLSDALMIASKVRERMLQ